MKKFLIIYTLIIGLPVFSACPVDMINESVCSLPDTNINIQPTYIKPNAGSNLSNNQKLLQTIDNTTFLNGMNQQRNQNMQYNSLCQFGVCMQDTNNSRYQSQ